MKNMSLSQGQASLEKVAGHVFPRQSPRRTPSSSSISPGPTETQPDGMAVPDSGSGPFGIRCPSTYPLVASLHGPTASLHLGLGTLRKGRFLRCLGSLKEGAELTRPTRPSSPSLPTPRRRFTVPLSPTGRLTVLSLASSWRGSSGNPACYNDFTVSFDLIAAKSCKNPQSSAGNA